MGPTEAEFVANAWTACEEPERPPDRFACWHMGGCTACAIKLDALERAQPQHPRLHVIRSIVRHQP